MKHRSGRYTIRTLGVAVALSGALAGSLVACSSTTTDNSTGGSTPAGAPSGGGQTLKVGYSAWPGWFPLAVAEEQKLFEKAGVKVELTYFADYTASLDALNAGQIDVNSQTLNDTVTAVASGSKQTVVVVNDNSTGNDQVICDASVKSVADLKGKTIGVELGVVDHFLLLQGLAKNNIGDKDVSIQGVTTAAAAAGFSGGQFDCVGVFAPFTVEAAKRPGSHVLFSSADFPGTIPDHLVATADATKSKADELQKLVDAWYLALDEIKAHPAETTAIMAKKAGTSTAEYDDFAKGTTIFDITKALNAFEDRKDDPSSLPEMARRTNAFLASSSIGKKEAPLEGLFEPRFTKATAAKRGNK